MNLYFGSFTLKKIVGEYIYLLYDETKNEERGLLHIENLRPEIDVYFLEGCFLVEED